MSGDKSNANLTFHPLQTSVFVISGLDCADCAAKLEKKIKSLAHVKNATLNFGAGKLTVEHITSDSEILTAIEEAGYQGQSTAAGTLAKTASNQWWKNPRLLSTFLAGILLALASLLEWFGHMEESVFIPLYSLALLVGGFYTAKSAFYSLKSLTFDMNFLMSIAVIGAVVLGEWGEAATVVFLFSLGNTLQSYTMDKTRQSIKALMELAPLEARVVDNHQEEWQPVESIAVGTVILVKPGERIPLDGTIGKGFSSINQAAITGESMPVDKGPGDVVYAGTLNQQGSLEIEVSKTAQDSTLSKIMHLVEEAQAQKAPSQHFVDVFAKYYTPSVISLAFGIAMIPWLFWQQPFEVWLYRALVLLVIACPCALVIATPVSIVSAIGNASRHGVLVKGGAYMEKLGTIQAVAFDKTGTLTTGRPTVTDVLALALPDKQQLLILAAALERHSEHPLAEAIVREATGLTPVTVENFKALTGRGLQGDINGKTVYLGSLRLFTELGHALNALKPQLQLLQDQGKTIMLMGTKEEIYGIIAVSDSLRPESAQTVNALRQLGIRSVTMLTGDNEAAAKNIAATLQLSAYHSELLPQDKVETVKNLNRQHGSILMVGDGVNDAPALAAADIGMAMGVAGSDTALETADIALMSDDLNKIPYAVKLSRKTMGIIKTNVFFAIVIKAFFLILTLLGLSNLWMAVFADTGAALLVILNSMRLMRSID